MKSSVLPLASNEFQSVIAFSIPTVIDPPFLGVPVLALFRPTVDLVADELLAALLQAVAVRASAPSSAIPAANRRFLNPDMTQSISSHARAGVGSSVPTLRQPQHGWCCLPHLWPPLALGVSARCEFAGPRCAWLNF